MQNQLLKQIQKMFQESLVRMQEGLATQVVEGTAGEGMIRVLMNGKQEVLSVTIDRSVVNPEEVDVLEDLLLIAVRDAISKSQAMVAEKMAQFTGGLDIPGLF